MRHIELFAALALLAGCAAAVTELGYPRVDSNDDGRVSAAEFAEFLDDVDAFERYDDNDDDRLSQEEYREAVDAEIGTGEYFRGFDRDNSGWLSEREFADGLFGLYDADGSGWLDEQEFENAVAALAFEL